MHIVRLSIALAVVWLLLSGHYNPLMLSFGVFSIAAVMLITQRMRVVDKESYPLAVNLSVLTYMVTLTVKIIQSNWDVVLRITGLRPTTSRFVRLPLPSDDELTNVIYANAITLTPGTASVAIEDNTLIVHTISEESARALLAGDIADILPRAKD